RTLRPADCLLQRLGRVRDGQGGRRERLDRRAADRAREPYCDEAGRRRLHLHLPRDGGERLATAVTSKSQALFERAQRVTPGGVTSPVGAFKSGGGQPRFFARARGARVWDADGNEYVDYMLSWGPLILGHSPPEVVAAIREAAENGTSYGAPTEREVEL